MTLGRRVRHRVEHGGVIAANGLHLLDAKLCHVSAERQVHPRRERIDVETGEKGEVRLAESPPADGL